MPGSPVHEAEPPLDDLIERARTEGPQVVIRQGIGRAVLLSVEDYRRLTGAQPDFKEWLLSIPKVDLEVDRSGDTGRSIDL